MANDCVMLEGSRVGVDEEGIELNLELSIGGSYAKSKKLMASGAVKETGRISAGEFVDPQAKNEIQALRKKRVNWKETNGFLSGASIDQDGSRVRDGIMLEPANKRGKNGPPVQFTNGFVNFYGGAKGGNLKRSCSKVGWPANASGGTSSAFSDFQNSNFIGGNASDDGSNSSYHQAKVQQQKNIPAASDPPEQSEHSGSSKQTESNQAVHSSTDSHGILINPNEEPKSDTDQSSPLINNPTSITNQCPSKEMSEAETSRPPPEPKMPCVTATGNGPNGKTVTGFLYRYNKNEVSIVCVCHGSSFSPAEFVEHAGGVDITHPLRHITVIPSAFG